MSLRPRNSRQPILSPFRPDFHFGSQFAWDVVQRSKTNLDVIIV